MLVDGRTVYGSLLSGVTWEQVDVLLEDIERIEVIRGPGATLWGANAMNGVINVITRKASATQGAMVVAGAGNEEHLFGGVRYGGEVSQNAWYRLYAKYFDRDNSQDQAGNEGFDGWRAVRGGFRFDWEPSGSDSFTLQGDAYRSRFDDRSTTWNLTPESEITVKSTFETVGANIIGRWKHTFTDGSDLIFQTYYDRIDVESASVSNLQEYVDVDLQYLFGLGERHEIVVGAGYTYSHDDLKRSLNISLTPSRFEKSVYSAFIHDEITLVEDTLRLIVGSKFEHNDFTGWEYQPNARLLWTPAEGHTVWGAVSRAVRTPSRIERQGLFRRQALTLNLPGLGTVPGQVVLIAQPDFKSEELLAGEMGYRFMVSDYLSIWAHFTTITRTCGPSTWERHSLPVTHPPMLLSPSMDETI